jgi:hypothetical protein
VSLLAGCCTCTSALMAPTINNNGMNLFIFSHKSLHSSSLDNDFCTNNFSTYEWAGLNMIPKNASPFVCLILVSSTLLITHQNGILKTFEFITACSSFKWKLPFLAKKGERKGETSRQRNQFELHYMFNCTLPDSKSKLILPERISFSKIDVSCFAFILIRFHKIFLR